MFALLTVSCASYEARKLLSKIMNTKTKRSAMHPIWSEQIIKIIRQTGHTQTHSVAHSISRQVYMHKTMPAWLHSKTNSSLWLLLFVLCMCNVCKWIKRSLALCCCWGSLNMVAMYVCLRKRMGKNRDASLFGIKITNTRSCHNVDGWVNAISWGCTMHLNTHVCTLTVVCSLKRERGKERARSVSIWNCDRFWIHGSIFLIQPFVQFRIDWIQ